MSVSQLLKPNNLDVYSAVQHSNVLTPETGVSLIMGAIGGVSTINGGDVIVGEVGGTVTILGTIDPPISSVSLSQGTNIVCTPNPITGTGTIATSLTPSFTSETLTALTNQLAMGTTNTVTINAAAPVASRVYTMADAGGNDSFAYLAATQALTNKTITDATNDVAANSLKSATTIVDVSAAVAPTAGQVLTATSGTAADWQTPATGSVTSISAGSNIICTPDPIVATGTVALSATPSVTSISVADGSAVAPSINFASDTPLGIYNKGAHVLGITYNGTEIATFGATNTNISNGDFLVAAGTMRATKSIADANNAAAPAFVFGSENTGMYLKAAGQIGFSILGSLASYIDSNGIHTLAPQDTYLFASGSSNAGIAYSGTNNVDIRSSGTAIASVLDTGVTFTRTASVPTNYATFKAPVFCYGEYTGTGVTVTGNGGTTTCNVKATRFNDTVYVSWSAFTITTTGSGAFTVPLDAFFKPTTAQWNYVYVAAIATVSVSTAATPLLTFGLTPTSPTFSSGTYTAQAGSMTYNVSL